MTSKVGDFANRYFQCYDQMGFQSACDHCPQLYECSTFFKFYYLILDVLKDQGSYEQSGRVFKQVL